MRSRSGTRGSRGSGGVDTGRRTDYDMPRARGHEQGTAGSVQRWRARHHHHDHGAGAEGAARGHAGVFGPARPGAARLRPQLRLRRHLLEQPPPPDAHGDPRDGRNDVGQPSPAVLAVAAARRDRLGRRVPPFVLAGRVLRRGAAGRGVRLAHSAAIDHPLWRDAWARSSARTPRASSRPCSTSAESGRPSCGPGSPSCYSRSRPRCGWYRTGASSVPTPRATATAPHTSEPRSRVAAAARPASRSRGRRLPSGC